MHQRTHPPPVFPLKKFYLLVEYRKTVGVSFLLSLSTERQSQSKLNFKTNGCQLLAANWDSKGEKGQKVKGMSSGGPRYMGCKVCKAGLSQDSSSDCHNRNPASSGSWLGSPRGSSMLPLCQMKRSVELNFWHVTNMNSA